MRLSPDEAEVWKTIEAYTACLSKKDWEGFFSYFHDDFIGWTSLRLAPVDKSSRQRWVPFMYRDAEIVEYEIQPLAVRVRGDTAIVHYLAFKAKRTPGGGELVKERWCDVLVRENGRWLLLGDAGGPM
jgi:ketosteroid isomerase-like protein